MKGMKEWREGGTKKRERVNEDEGKDGGEGTGRKREEERE